MSKLLELMAWLKNLVQSPHNSAIAQDAARYAALRRATSDDNLKHLFDYEVFEEFGLDDATDMLIAKIKEYDMLNPEEV